jgi:hypothetical protein
MDIDNIKDLQKYYQKFNLDLGRILKSISNNKGDLLELQQTFLNIVKKFDILRSTYT